MDQAISKQVLALRSRAKFATAAALLATCCAIAWGINFLIRPSIAAGELAIGTVHKGSIANTINASGIVVSVHEELVSSPIQSHVAKVHAKLGQQVATGELLLELDDQAIKLALAALKEQLAQQDNRIDGLTLELEQKRKQLQSSIELLGLDLQSARVKWERAQTLRKSGLVSGEDFLTAELNVKRTEIQLRQQRELIEDYHRATLSNIDGAKLQKDILQKQIEQQEQLLAQAQVRAPFAGMLTALAADEGASVMTGQLLARVSELNNYRVEASLSDFHAHVLSPGQAVRIEQGGQSLSGRVGTILPEIQNGIVKLLVTLDQPNHPMLKNKMRVDVNIVTEQKDNVLVVDAGPAFNGRGRQAAFMVKDGTARKFVLDIGDGDGKAVEIASGAQSGDRIIISDTSRFRDHDSIRISQ